MTTILAAPPSGEAFEPTLAIDPADASSIIVAAMNGIPPFGTSDGIWVWRSVDGGRTWTDGGLAVPRSPGDEGPEDFAADVVAAFSVDGTALLASMSGLGGASFTTFASRVPVEPTAATGVPVLSNIRDALGRWVFYDKPWITVDRLDGSPHRGSVYLSEAALVMEALPPKLGEPWPGPLISRVELANSRDGGRTFSAPTLVSDSAFAAQLAVTPGGVLEVTYARMVNKQGDGDAVFHRRSTDGGLTFGPPAVITAVAGDTLLDLPVLAARPNGDLLVCWSQGVRRDERRNQVRCATRPAGGVWSGARGVDASLPSDAAEAWPAIVGTDRGWYLMQYVVGSSRTEVVLYHSGDGARFERLVSLGAAEGLGTDRFCLNAGPRAVARGSTGSRSATMSPRPRARAVWRRRTSFRGVRDRVPIRRRFTCRYCPSHHSPSATPCRNGGRAAMVARIWATPAAAAATRPLLDTVATPSAGERNGSPAEEVALSILRDRRHLLDRTHNQPGCAGRDRWVGITPPPSASRRRTQA